MGPGEPQPKPAPIRRWFGWSRDLPTVAVAIDDDAASVLCLRRRSVITACGRITLPPGTVRNGRFRVAGAAIEALRQLRTELHLPGRCRAVLLVKPSSATATGAPTGVLVTAKVDADDAAARRQVADAAGFGSVALEPVPAALSRLGPAVHGPIYAEGGGWRTYRDGDHLEIEPSDRTITGVVMGPSPAERGPLPGPDPIIVDRGVKLLGCWPLLLGAALADTGRRPESRIEETGPSPVGGWTIERVGVGEGERR